MKEQELREQFKNDYMGDYVPDLVNEPLHIADWWLSKMKYQREELLKEIEGKIRSYEHDKTAHAQGKCSHSMAVCSAIEQEVKMSLQSIINEVKGE